MFGSAPIFASQKVNTIEIPLQRVMRGKLHEVSARPGEAPAPVT